MGLFDLNISTCLFTYKDRNINIEIFYTGDKFCLPSAKVTPAHNLEEKALVIVQGIETNLIPGKFVFNNTAEITKIFFGGIFEQSLTGANTIPVHKILDLRDDSLTQESRDIIDQAYSGLKEYALNFNIASEMLGSTFIASDVIGLYQALFPNKNIDSSNLRRFLLRTKAIVDTNKTLKSESGRHLKMFKVQEKYFEQPLRLQDKL